jgi:hypothetical protein
MRRSGFRLYGHCDGFARRSARQWGRGAGGGPDGRYGISPYRASPDDPVEVAARCALNAAGTQVTSQSAQAQRWAAAVRAFNRMRSSLPPHLLERRYPVATFFTVMYGDGSTQTWTVVQPSSVAAPLSQTPVAPPTPPAPGNVNCVGVT